VSDGRDVPEGDPEFEIWVKQKIEAELAAGRASARELLDEAARRRAEENQLIDFSTAPRPRFRWFVFRKRFESAWDDLEHRYRAWYSAQRVVAGLPPLPDPEEERLIDGTPIAPRDPEIDAAMRRLDRVTDRMPVQGTEWRAREPRVIRVVLDPYKERHARRIRKACLPLEARVERPVRPR
jgi:hypothetical protein